MTISHNPSTLPKHCIDTTGHLRKDLLRPASQTYHQNMILSGTEIGTIFTIDIQEQPDSSLSKKVFSTISTTTNFFHK